MLNGDDELLSGLTLPFETVLCGRHERCGVRVTNEAEHGIEGVTCTVTTKREVYEVAIPSPGAYMIYRFSIWASPTLVITATVGRTISPR